MLPPRQLLVPTLVLTHCQVLLLAYFVPERRHRRTGCETRLPSLRRLRHAGLAPRRLLLLVEGV
jgi:hypothetical protein